MQSVFLIIHVLAACGLIVLVLLQHGRGADAGAAFGSGASGTMFGSRGPASFLTRITALLAATFFFTSLSLAYLSGKSIERRSLMDRVETVETDLPAGTGSAPADIPADSVEPESDLPDVPGMSRGDVPSVGDVPTSPPPDSGDSPEPSQGE